MKLKILHTEASCGWGGQEIRILSEAAGLIGRGHEVTLVCPGEAPIYREAHKRGIPVTALPIGRKRLRGIVSLRRYLVANRFDVINCHSSTDSWLAAAACATLHKPPPLVRTRHISAPVPNNPATRWLYTHATRHIVTTGTKLRQQLIDDNHYSPARITSVPTGIDTGCFVPGDRMAARMALQLDPAPRYIGIVATLRSWKGHLFLLEACARLVRSDWRLLIVGDGPMRDVLEKKIDELKLNDRVLMLGHREDPQRWLQALDVFCLPSYANEGVPQALLQAMMTGLPVIATPVGSITDAVCDGQTGLLVPPKDVAALEHVLADDALATRLGDAAHASAITTFGREAMLSRMEYLFEMVSATR